MSFLKNLKSSFQCKTTKCTEKEPNKEEKTVQKLTF